VGDVDAGVAEFGAGGGIGAEGGGGVFGAVAFAGGEGEGGEEEQEEGGGFHGSPFSSPGHYKCEGEKGEVKMRGGRIMAAFGFCHLENTMSMMRVAVMAIVVAGAGMVWAEGAATGPATSMPAATIPAGAIAPTDKDALGKSEGKEITVVGKVSRASWISSGTIMFINFEGNQRGDFVGIVKKENKETLDKAFEGDMAKALTGKKVTLTGKVLKYKDTPQIEVTKAEQVVVEKE
jgi:DNA/RNA endonuclease YhcR with UshA esterase domain